MTDGVRVVGGTGTDLDERSDAAAQPAMEEETEAGVTPAEPVVTTTPLKPRRFPRSRRRLGVVGLAVLAALGIAGTVGFGLAWASVHAQQSGESQAQQSARSFLVDLTNFNDQTVDADFSAVTSMATGKFATQAASFFNSSIRQELQKALASSRGQIRNLYVQSYGGSQATVYAVVDQLYVNDKVTSPQTDVLRVVVSMTQVGGSWKVGDLTVLQGPTVAGGTAGTATAAIGSTTTTTAPGS
jgi:hypothetical protein